MTRRGGLGRGLGALIPTGPATSEPADGAAAGAPTGSEAAPTGAAAHGRSTQSPESLSPGNVPAGARPSLHSVSDVDADADGPLPVPGAWFTELAVDAITTNAKQPRQVFDDEALSELTHSVREFGVLQPIVVRQTPTGYELVMGERRLRAAIAAGLSLIPAIVRETSDDAMLRDALLENIHRSALNPLEEAAAYQQLLAEFGSTHDELATRLGRSRSQVSNTIRLLNLSVAVQRRVAAGVLSAGHARALLGLAERDQQDELAARIVAEGLSVRATEELVALAARQPATEKTTRTRTASVSSPRIAELADRLADVFETRVRVDLGRRKGKITLEFATVDDLERIVAMMAPELLVRPGQQ
jgi:ParB family transcriptional regulator, chromosome partitioning protein